jgi:hypothetical protein
MDVADALGQRGSKCVNAARRKSPMMAWITVCDDYFTGGRSGSKGRMVATDEFFS